MFELFEMELFLTLKHCLHKIELFNIELLYLFWIELAELELFE